MLFGLTVSNDRQSNGSVGNLFLWPVTDVGFTLSWRWLPPDDSRYSEFWRRELLRFGASIRECILLFKSFNNFICRFIKRWVMVLLMRSLILLFLCLRLLKMLIFQWCIQYKFFFLSKKYFGRCNMNIAKLWSYLIFLVYIF